MKHKPLSHIVAGLITGSIFILMLFYYYYRNLLFRKDFATVMAPYLVTIIVIIIFVVLWGRAMNNKVTFGNLFRYGFRTTIIFVLLTSAFLFSNKYIFPDYKERFIAEMRKRVSVQRDIPEDQKAAYLKHSEDFFNVTIVGGALFMNLIAGTAGALLGASISKKRQSPIDQQE